MHAGLSVFLVVQTTLVEISCYSSYIVIIVQIPLSDSFSYIPLTKSLCLNICGQSAE